MLQRSIIVQPCYSLEDLTRDLDETSAGDYHAAWTSMWHPQLLLAIGSLPEWKRSDSSSLDVRSALIVVPSASKTQLDTTLRERIDLNENVVFESLGQRTDNVKAIATLLGIGDVRYDVAANDVARDEKGRMPVCVETFYALGFAFQQLNILTRKVHYSTNLDLMLLHEQVTKAATAYLANDAEESERWMQSCFDQLSQERDRYFSQQANLIDLTLIAKSTIGEALSKQLKIDRKQNLLCSASMLERVQNQNCIAFDAIKRQIGTKAISIIGGLDHESASPWLSNDQLLRSLSDGRRKYLELMNHTPKVFARLTGGIQANDAQLLRIAGFPYAVLSSWLDGEVPAADQAKIRWQSADTSTIDAIAAFVLQANSTLSVLSIAMQFAKQFDYHQVPTVVLAHWPSENCEAFRDLVIATERTAALGTWRTLDDYFETTGQAYSNTSLATSKFDYPLPSTLATLGEFSMQLARAAKCELSMKSLRNLGQLASQLASWLKRGAIEAECNDLINATIDFQSQVDQWLAKSMNDYRATVANQAVGSIELSVDRNESWFVSHLQSLMNELATMTSQLVSGKPLSKTIAKFNLLKPTEHASCACTFASSVDGIAYVVNPHSVPMRFFLRTATQSFACDEASRIYASDNSTSATRLLQSMNVNNAGGNELIVDVPSGGVVQLMPQASSSGTILRRATIAVSSQQLSNEYLDVQIDPKTGNLRALLITRKRGSRLSGQLSILNPTAMLGGGKSKDARYAATRNVKLQTKHNSTASAIIAAQGELVFDSKKLAEFTIQYELWRGSRMVQITPHVRWSVDLPADSTAWNGAAVWRSAWSNEAASLRIWQHDFPTKHGSSNLFSSRIIELEDADHRLYIMTDGVCLHRRYDSRYIDSHLGTGQGVSFMAGLDVPNPLQQWSSWVNGPIVFSGMEPLANAQSSASFWSSSHRGLSLDWLDRRFFVQENDASPEKFDGYIKLQETIGRGSTADLRFFRDLKNAARLNCTGAADEQLAIVDGECRVPIRSCETILIGVNWA
jgi:hypothetical protein